MKTKQLSTPRGFTLIELLIVIAVLGVLAAVVLVAINPIEQLARARDAGRKTTVGQLKNAIQAYFTSRNGTYPAEGSTWIQTLVDASEIKKVPAAITYSIDVSLRPCLPATNNQIDFCYDIGAVSGNPEVIVYTELESGSEKTKCPSTETAFFMWSSVAQQAGVFCTADTDPDENAASFTLLP